MGVCLVILVPGEDTHTFHLDLIVTNSVLPVVCSMALWFRDTPGSLPCD